MAGRTCPVRNVSPTPDVKFGRLVVLMMSKEGEKGWGRPLPASGVMFTFDTELQLLVLVLWRQGQLHYFAFSRLQCDVPSVTLKTLTNFRVLPIQLAVTGKREGCIGARRHTGQFEGPIWMSSRVDAG